MSYYSGTMCGVINTSNFTIAAGQTVTVTPYNPSTGGTGVLEVHADYIQIDGTINADGAGYAGGPGGGGGSGNMYHGSWAGPRGSTYDYITDWTQKGGYSSGTVDAATGNPNPSTNYNAGNQHLNTGTNRPNASHDEGLDSWINAYWVAAYGKVYGASYNNVGNGACFGAFGGCGYGPTAGLGGYKYVDATYLDTNPGPTIGQFITTSLPVGSYKANTLHGPGIASEDGITGANATANINTSYDYNLNLGSGGGGGGGGSGAAFESEQGNSGGGGGGGAGANGGGVVKLFAKISLIINGNIYCRGSTNARDGSYGFGFHIIPGHNYPLSSSTAYNPTGVVNGQGGPIDFAGAGGQGGDGGKGGQNGIGGLGGNHDQQDKTFTWSGGDYDGVTQYTKDGGKGGDGGGGSGGGILLHCYENMIITNPNGLNCNGSLRSGSVLTNSTTNGGSIKLFYGINLTITDHGDVWHDVSNRCLLITTLWSASQAEALYFTYARFDNKAAIVAYPLWKEYRQGGYQTGKGFIPVTISSNNFYSCGGNQSKITQSWNANDDLDLLKNHFDYSQVHFVSSYDREKQYNTITTGCDFNIWENITYVITTTYYANICIPLNGETIIYTRDNPAGHDTYRKDAPTTGSGTITQCDPLGIPNITGKSYPANIITPVIFYWSAPTPSTGLLNYTYYVYQSNGTLYSSGTVSTLYTPSISITTEGDYYCIVRANHKMTGCPAQDSARFNFHIYGYCPTPGGTITPSISTDECIDVINDNVCINIGNDLHDCTHMDIYLDDSDIIFNRDPPLVGKVFCFMLNNKLTNDHTEHSLKVKLINACGGERITTEYISPKYYFWTKYNLSLPQFTPLIESETPMITEGTCLSAFIDPNPNSDTTNYWDSSCRLFVTTTSASTGVYYSDDGITLNIDVTSTSFNTLFPPVCVFAPVDTDSGLTVTYKAWGERDCAVSNVKTITYGIIAYDNPIVDFWSISGMTVSNNYSRNYNNFAIPNITAYKDTDGLFNNFISGYAPNLTITFQESCIPEITPISSYNWDFGDYYMDTINTSAMDLTANSDHTGRINPRYSRENFVTYLTNHTVEHTYIVPGYYDITLTATGSANPITISIPASKEKQTAYRTHSVYVEEIMPIPCFEIRNNISEFSNTIQFSGDTPLTICAIASCLSAGSFPIHKIEYDWGDGSEITVLDNYPTSLFDPLTTVACHDYVRLFSLEKDTYVISMSAYAEITDSMVTASLTIGPVSFQANSANVVDAEQVRLIAGKLHNVDNKNLLVFEDQINNRVYNFVASGL